VLSPKEPFYIALSDSIREQIESKELSFGEPIPSERTLAETYGVSRMTVQNAVNLLVNEGILTRVHGKGTFVKNPKLDSTMAVLQGFGRFLEQQGMKSTSKVIFCGIRPAGYKFHKIFGIDANASVFRLFRVRLGDGEPISVEDTYIPYDLVPGIEKYDFQICSLYQAMEEYGIYLAEGTEKLEIIRILNPEAKLLGLKPGSMAFHLENTSKDKSGRIVEFTLSFTHGERFRFSSQTD